MRLRFVAGTVVLFVCISILLSAALFFPNFSLVRGHNDYAAPIDVSNVIKQENAQQGTYKWKINKENEANTEIQAYAGATSVPPGQKLTFYVSTQSYGIRYSIAIFRLGWYGGEGGRQLYYHDGLVGEYQGYYDQKNHKLFNCSSCHIDNRLIEANWQPSYTLTIPADWVTGVYLAKFTDAHGKQTYTPFDVRGNFSSRYVAVTSDTTYAAYNEWGGWSLYPAGSGIGLNEATSDPKAAKVSFDRPYTSGLGSGQVLTYEINAIRWMERQGYDLSYMSSVDLHEHPAQLLQHRAYISLGHDEYWTKEMRDGVEYARDHGVGLAFLGADASYWQMRFEPDSKGTPDRTIACYKVLTNEHDLARDPLYGRDNSRLTTQWRDPALNRPESTLIGVMFSGVTNDEQLRGFPWQINPQGQSPLLDGTGLEPGESYGCDLVGYEWDRVFTEHAPTELQVISTSRTINENNQVDYSNTTYYVAPSGAMVFATGSINWTTALDDYRLNTDNLCSLRNLVMPGIQKLMAKVMEALVVLHPSQPLASELGKPASSLLTMTIHRQSAGLATPSESSWEYQLASETC